VYKIFEVRRFILVGVINTIFGYSASMLMLLSFQSTWAALGLANTLSVLFSYYTQASLVFKKKLHYKTFYFFVSYYLIILVTQVNLLRLLNHYTGNSLISFTIIFPVITLVTMVVYKKIIFRARK